MKLGKYHKILDSSAFIGGYIPLDKKNYTIPEVTDELEDLNSKMILQRSLQEGNLKIMDPATEYIKKVDTITERSGDVLRLSKVDKKIIALALQLKDELGDVMLITDDYSIQNVMGILDIPFQGVLTYGIIAIYGWEKICSGCRKIYPHDYPYPECEICGSKIVKRRKKRRTHNKTPDL